MLQEGDAGQSVAGPFERFEFTQVHVVGQFQHKGLYHAVQCFVQSGEGAQIFPAVDCELQAFELTLFLGGLGAADVLNDLCRCADRVLCFNDDCGQRLAADQAVRTQLNHAGAATAEVERIEAVFGFSGQGQFGLLFPQRHSFVGQVAGDRDFVDWVFGQ